MVLEYMTSETRLKSNDARKKLSRKILLDSARDTFLENGYHKTLISDIVSKANVGQGTFYRHFSSKREIFEALLDTFSEELINEFKKISEHLPENIEEYYFATISATQRFTQIMERNKKLITLFLRDAQTIDTDFENKIYEIYEQFALVSKFYLDHAIEKGFVRKFQTEIISRALIGMGLHLIDLWRRDVFSTIETQTIIQEVVNFAFKGFGVSQTESN